MDQFGQVGIGDKCLMYVGTNDGSDLSNVV